ncbi:MAG: peptidoglycan-binding protein [Rhodoplanes sp.]
MARAIDIVRKVAPDARPNYLAAFEAGDALLRKHGITTPLRLAHFLAQVMHESGGLTIEWENLSYRTPARLLEIFGQGHHSAGVTLSELSGLLGNPQALADRVYGLGNPRKARELGNSERGDGFRYRGGGILQTTGRSNYRRMGEKCGVDFEGHPELVVSAEHALRPALTEWSEGNLNAAADRDDIVAITRKINGGLNGLADRRARLAKLRSLINSVEFVEGADTPRPRTSGSTESAPGITAPPLAPSSPTPSPVLSDLAHRIVAAMERKGHRVDRGPGEINIVYVEGMNADGTPNGDEANKWNDLRLVIRFEGGEPRIVGSWPATTEPGRYYTENPVNPRGAARIEFGQYDAWQVGKHRGDHEALVQTGGQVTVCRDLNKDGQRTGDKRDTGDFGINQHWGYDLAEVDKASAGCLVGQSKPGHRQFMTVVKSDPRYQADRKYVFTTTVLAESDVLAERTPETPLAEQEREKVPVQPSDVSETVRLAQKLLGFPEEEQDGIYGAITEEAVKRLQRQHGLPVTGDLDEATWDKLESDARPVEGAKPVEPPKRPAEPITRPFEPRGLGVEAMNPLIMIAARVLPGIIQAIAGDKAGTVAGAVTKAVTDITRTQNPKEAEDKLNTDPAAVVELQLKLAEIANAQEEARQKAQLALLKEQNEQEIKRQQAQLEALKQQSEADAKKREADFQALQAKLDDTKDARASLRGLAAMPGADKWVLRSPPVLSYIITMGFFLVLGFLLLFGIAPWAQNGKSAEQVVYIVIGALTAALATVVNFWLGSSQSSQRKDVANERQTAQNAELIERSAKQNAEILEQSAKRNADLLKTVMKSEPAAKVEKPAKQLERCLDIVLKQEAILERSGVTKFGITLEELQSSRNDQSLADKNLMELSRDDAYEFYRMRY